MCDLNLRAFIDNHDVKNRRNMATIGPFGELVCLHRRRGDNRDNIGFRQASKTILCFLIALIQTK